MLFQAGFVQAQEHTKFLYQVGFGSSFIPIRSNYSPWGATYRNNYKSGFTPVLRSVPFSSYNAWRSVFATSS